MLSLLEAAIFASSCSIDAFAASFAYGSKRIRIPLLSNQIINAICSGTLGLSLLLGSFIRQYLPPPFTAALCFVILFILGLMKLLDGVITSVIRNLDKRGGLNKEFKFSIFSLIFILNIYANPEIADIDENKIISSGEAAALALSLSLDGFAVGFGAGVGSINILAVVLTSLAANMCAVVLGCRLGERLSHALPINLSWLSGIILIALAVTKLL